MEVKNILQESESISKTEQDELLAGSEKYFADLEKQQYTILIAGKTNDCFCMIFVLGLLSNYKNLVIFFRLFSIERQSRKIDFCFFYFAKTYLWVSSFKEF